MAQFAQQYWISGLVILSLFSSSLSAAAEPTANQAAGDKLLAEYFEQQTARLRDRCLADVQSLEDWQARRELYREQLLEMLGLDPLPERTDLKVEVTGTTEHEDIVVEKLHFQSRPGLYVTANLYRPRHSEEERLPAILYLCGHGAVKQNGISYGNKVHYQHHGIWFARNGYICLTLDSLQLGEIEGIHHGTHRYGMWWWLSRGYTPAGVEAWNCVRALDYLQSRADVDPDRLGATGRSGGGAYSWWIAAIDDRIKATVPVAGITDLENHIVDGCIEGHCDCMFQVNTYEWDYPLVAALVAPRPLLISNTDHDSIFPLDGVLRTYWKVRQLYGLHGADSSLGLNITAGPHQDSQSLQVHAFRWFDQHLKKVDRPIAPAERLFEPEQLRVFRELPDDQINTTIEESFVPAAVAPAEPADSASWQQLRDTWLAQLDEKVFRAWPDGSESLQVELVCSSSQDGIRFEAIDFTSQAPFRLRLYALRSADAERPERVELVVLDESTWPAAQAALRAGFPEETSDDKEASEADPAGYRELAERVRSGRTAVVFFAPRGVGRTAWSADEKKQVQYRRRFYLLGQTLDAMRVWDLRRAVQAVRSLGNFATSQLVLQGTGSTAGLALYASLYEPNLAGLELTDLPESHREGPYLLNVQRVLDLPQSVALAAEATPIILYDTQSKQWQWPLATARQLGWGEQQIQVLPPPSEALGQ